MRFGSWLALSAADWTSAPEKSVCFQVRVKSGLIAYPRGKSAMVAYGAAASPAEACRAFLQSPLHVRAEQYGPLLIRFAEPDPHGGTAEEQIDRLRRRFIDQFGAPPLAELSSDGEPQP